MTETPAQWAQAMSGPVITLAMIEAHEACEDQVQLFKQLYPSGEVIVTRESVRAAAEAGLSVAWGSNHLLKGRFLKAYHAAIAAPHRVYLAKTAEPLVAYRDAIAEPQKVYHSRIAGPQKAYYPTLSVAYKVYRDAIAEPLVAYRDAIAEPNKDYNVAMAESFANAFIAQAEMEKVT